MRPWKGTQWKQWRGEQMQQSTLLPCLSAKHPTLLLSCTLRRMHSAGPIQHQPLWGLRRTVGSWSLTHLRCASVLLKRSVLTDHHEQVSHSIASMMPATSTAAVLAGLVTPWRSHGSLSVCFADPAVSGRHLHTGRVESFAGER